MSWLQISVNTTKNHAEIAEDCLFATGAQTVTLTDAADQPILEPGPDETPVWNNVTITGLFSLDENQQSLLDEINHCLADIDFSCDAQILEEQNWTRAWMDHFHAMQFGQRLWVCPLHIEPPEADAVNLRLDPGLAFGTGTHPTTSLCLRWLDQNIAAENSAHNTLLDFGCGSGILAIAACMRLTGCMMPLLNIWENMSETARVTVSKNAVKYSKLWITWAGTHQIHFSGRGHSA